MKTKEIHFENIWEDCESLITVEDSQIHFIAINKAFEDVENDPNKALGVVLLHIAALSKKYNVNVAKAMVDQLEELKIDNLE